MFHYTLISVHVSWTCILVICKGLMQMHLIHDYDDALFSLQTWRHLGSYTHSCLSTSFENWTVAFVCGSEFSGMEAQLNQSHISFHMQSWTDDAETPVHHDGIPMHLSCICHRCSLLLTIPKYSSRWKNIMHMFVTFAWKWVKQIACKVSTCTVLI